MEVDTVHSIIERKLKIYQFSIKIPGDYVEVINEARALRQHKGVGVKHRFFMITLV